MKTSLLASLLGSTIILAGAAGALADSPPVLSNVVLFNTDSAGANQGIAGGVIEHGCFTTVLDQQNIPGNYGAELFLTQVTNPTASNFLTPSSNTSIPLSLGSNVLYFYGDGNDAVGGTAGFGLNLYFDSAAAPSPALSGYSLNSQGQVAADSSSTTASYAYKVIPGTGTLSFVSGNYTITLSNFVVTAIGGSGGNSTVDLVNSTNIAPFSPPAHSDGITDTYGQFTLSVTATPEPASLSLLGVGSMICLFRRTKRTQS